MKGVILINAYTQSEAELNQPGRLREELALCGVRADIRRNLLLSPEEICAEYGFCVYFDKDKYCARQLEEAGIRLFNRAGAIETCDDKMLTCLALTGLPMPETIAGALCYTPEEPVREETLDEIEARLGYPVVVKECYGSLGKGVYKADDRTQLALIAERVKCRPHLFQEFIAESSGQDVRAIVIGGKFVCAMRRRSRDFRSNVSLGGRGEPFRLSGEGVRLCEEAAKKLSLDYCGIDLLFGKNGFLICEVNSNAFFGGIERVTGINVARRYAQHILKEIKA